MPIVDFVRALPYAAKFNPNVLINLVSRRVRQLNSAAVAKEFRSA